MSTWAFLIALRKVALQCSWSNLLLVVLILARPKRQNVPIDVRTSIMHRELLRMSRNVIIDWLQTVSLEVRNTVVDDFRLRCRFPHAVYRSIKTYRRENIFLFRFYSRCSRDRISACIIRQFHRQADPAGRQSTIYLLFPSRSLLMPDAGSQLKNLPGINKLR